MAICLKAVETEGCAAILRHIQTQGLGVVLIAIGRGLRCRVRSGRSGFWLARYRGQTKTWPGNIVDHPTPVLDDEFIGDFGRERKIGESRHNPLARVISDSFGLQGPDDFVSVKILPRNRNPKPNACRPKITSMGVVVVEKRDHPFREELYPLGWRSQIGEALLLRRYRVMQRRINPLHQFLRRVGPRRACCKERE
ncbi:MAG: hypothetical protein AB3N11_08380 [Arenibacterium sp.]